MNELAAMWDFAVTAFQTDFTLYEDLEQGIRIGIAALSLVLLALSLSAYRRTRIRPLLFAAGAFGLFAVQMVVEYLEESMGVGTPYVEIVTPAFTFASLVLFFLAIAGKRPSGSETGPG